MKTLNSKTKKFPEFCKSMKCHYHLRYINRKDDDYSTYPWLLVRKNEKYICADKLPCLYLPPHKENITKELEFINFLWLKELGIKEWKAD